MLNLSYTISPKLNVLLQSIDRTRAKVQLISLPRDQEAQFAWRAKLGRTYYSLSMSGSKIKRKQMASLLSKLTTDHNQKLNREQKEVINYFYAQDYINYNWHIKNNHVSANDVYHLYKLSSQETFGDSRSYFNQNIQLTNQLLEYISQGDEHPVIKAGIIQMQLRVISPFINSNGRITRLLAQLYLYKNAYDMRGFLVLDEYWKRNINRYRQEVDVARKSENMTGWLEFYAQGFESQLEKALNTVRGERKVPGVKKSFWNLNKRQKQILAILENPDLSLTNNDVQKKFNVSQITASRDLSKLMKLDLIFRHGGGRSVYYTRV